MEDRGERLLLQRLRITGDAGRWRTVLVVPLHRLDDAARLIGLADDLDATLRWRLTIDAPGADTYHWTNDRWVIDAPA